MTSRPLLSRLIITLGILLLAPGLRAQTIFYTDGQTDPTNYSTPTELLINSGVARQTGVLGGFGDYFKFGGGKLSLSAVNTFTGNMVVYSGTLNIFNNSNLGASANLIQVRSGSTLQTSSTYNSHQLDIDTDGTIDVAQGFTTLQNAALTGAGTLTKTGGGTFFLGAGADNTFSGSITLATNGGTFQIGSSVSSSPAGGATLSGLSSANTITVNRGATFNIQDNGTNSSAGYIADRLGSAGNHPWVTMNGGTFNLNGANNAAIMTQSVGPLFLNSGASTINVTRNTAGTPELVFDILSRASGAFVNFTGTALGTGTNDARILSPDGINGIYPALVGKTGTAGLIGGGGASGSTTMSVLTGARSGNDLVTYDANGIRPLAAAEYNAVAGNNINSATVTQNVKISDAAFSSFAALTAPRTINALVNTAATFATWAMGNTLTLTSGQFISSGTSLNISSGVLTAGTGAPGFIDLDMTINLATVTVAANINDNGFTSVALVKNGSTNLSLSNNTTNNTYSGGTFINEGTLTTGGTGSRRYLGTGPVVVNGGGQLVLGANGATSFTGDLASPTYTVRTGGLMRIANIAPAANEFFRIEPGAVFVNTGTTGAGGVNILSNMIAYPGAVLAQTVTGANVALRYGGSSITSLTTPTYHFGLAASAIQENITVGAGTPWLGISTGLASVSLYGGATTNNTLTANSDFSLQGMAIPGTGGASTFATLSLGTGSVPNIVKIATPNGSVNANILGSVTLNNSISQYGSGVGNTVTFQVTSGATLTAQTSTAMGVIAGAATSSASIVVQNGGTLVIGNSAAINGNVAVQPGGMVTQSLGGLSGTGTFTHSNGSILNLTGSSSSVSGATQSLGTVPGTIVRMGFATLQPGTSTAGVTQFDSRLDDAAVYEVTGLLGMGNAAAATDSLFTLSASGGIGGVLTNDATTRTLGAATGLIAIGSGGGTFAATTGTTFSVSEEFALGSNTLMIGSAQSYDGNPKLGIVSLNTNLNTGSAGSIISVIDGATLQLGVSNSIPSATRLNVNTGGTFDLGGISNTIESLTGGGTVTNTGAATTLTLSPTTTDADFSGSLTATTPANLALTKSGSGTQKLSGPSTYGGATTVSQGTLEVTANNALGSNAAGTSVSDGAALKLAGVNYTTTEAVSINGTGISNGGALVNSGTSTFAGPVTAATNASINAGGGTLTLTGGLVKNGTTATIMGGGRVNISGTGISGASANSDLVVDGTTLVVSAASNYNGPTTVQNSGTFVANAQIDTTSMTVSANSTLSGTGKVVAANNGLITINGALVVGDSTITPVASMLDLDTSGLGSAVLASTSKFYLDLFADAGDNTGNTAAADRLRWFGALTIDSLAQLYITDSTGSMAFAWGDKWIIGDLTGGTLGGNYSDANINGPALTGGRFWHTELVGNALVLSVAPEPSRALLLMLGMSGLALRRRRGK